jgi:hypothetical protein
MRWESPPLKKIKHAFPTNGVKSFPNVQFEEGEGQSLGFVESCGKVLDI